MLKNYVKIILLIKIQTSMMNFNRLNRSGFGVRCDLYVKLTLLICMLYKMSSMFEENCVSVV